MDLYSLPNDDGKTYRRKKFLSLLKNPERGYIDGATDYCLLVAFADDHDLDRDERFLLAYLYGLSYSQTTAIRTYMEFWDLEGVKAAQLERFWKLNKNSLYFNPDRKYVKNNDAFVPALLNIKNLAGYDPTDYWENLLEGGFSLLYKRIKKDWFYFGPMGIYLFLDALYGLIPDWYVDPDQIDWRHCGQTVPEGMAHLLYQDDLVESGSYPLEVFNSIVKKIQRKTDQPVVLIESTLCAFRKLFKGTRYVGYYADRMLLECQQTDSYLRDLGVDIWSYRAQVIPQKYLGEVNGWSGIREDRMKLWLKKGVLY